MAKRHRALSKLGLNLLRCREAKKLSQEALAEKADLNYITKNDDSHPRRLANHNGSNNQLLSQSRRADGLYHHHRLEESKGLSHGGRV